MLWILRITKISSFEINNAIQCHKILGTNLIFIYLVCVLVHAKCVPVPSKARRGHWTLGVGFIGSCE